MFGRFQTVALAAALSLVGPSLAAQVSTPNPFAIERADPDVAARHPRPERGHRQERRRLEHRGERLERRGDRMERRGRRWEHRGERMERRAERPGQRHRHPARHRHPDGAI